MVAKGQKEADVKAAPVKQTPRTCLDSKQIMAAGPGGGATSLVAMNAQAIHTPSMTMPLDGLA
eukprot:6083349-Prorocentrum_lima.AAC.1